MITDAYVDAEKTLDLTIKSGVHPSGARYKVDLRTMQQTNVSSGMVRPVKIVMPETTAVIKAVKMVPIANGIQVCLVYASERELLSVLAGTKPLSVDPSRSFVVQSGSWE